jgi:hypothetical protein
VVALRHRRSVDEPVGARRGAAARVGLGVDREHVHLFRAVGRDDGDSTGVGPFVIGIGLELELVELHPYIVHLRSLTQGEEHVADGLEGEVLVAVGCDAPLAVVAVEELLEGDGNLLDGSSTGPDVLDEGLLLGEIHAVSAPAVEVCVEVYVDDCPSVGRRSGVGYTGAACRLVPPRGGSRRPVRA